MVETAAIVAVVLGVVEAFKQVGFPSKYAGIASIGLGVLAALAFGGVTALSVFTGVTYGLMAAGLYSGTKAVLQ